MGGWGLILKEESTVGCKSELLLGRGSFSGSPVLGVGGKSQGQESVGRSAMSGIRCLFGSQAGIFRWRFCHGKKETSVSFALLFQVEIRNIQLEGSTELLLT